MVTADERITIDEAADTAKSVLSEVGRAVVGKDDALELLLMALLADGHVLIEDFPGLAKTLMARSFAVATGLDFARVQFTPDQMPMDITGAPILDPAGGDFIFRPGPIFTNLLLADEINRAPAKTQAALLEAMQERQVTVDGVSHPVPRPFLVVATQNPIEYEGTYPLPEAQLDRFLIRIGVGYPSPEAEWQILHDRADRGTDEVELSPVIGSGRLRAMQQAVERVHLEEDVGRYIVALVKATRSHSQVLVGASPRGSLAIMKMARAKALLAGLDFVTPDDAKAVAVPALSHRLILRPEAWVRDVTSTEVVEELLDTVPTPSTAPH
ncbi:MAG: MoxR family ATPase [Acidimicrobiia bacterium]|nr:MAG: MoxR family ATPase [Acidimicrobiia bacterium]